MRSGFVVVAPPLGGQATHLVERLEPVRVQAFVAQSPVETLDQAVLRWLAGGNERDLDLFLICPGVKDVARELGSVVAGERLHRGGFDAGADGRRGWADA